MVTSVPNMDNDLTPSLEHHVSLMRETPFVLGGFRKWIGNNGSSRNLCSQRAAAWVLLASCHEGDNTDLIDP